MLAADQTCLRIGIPSSLILAVQLGYLIVSLNYRHCVTVDIASESVAKRLA